MNDEPTRNYTEDKIGRYIRLVSMDMGYFQCSRYFGILAVGVPDEIQKDVYAQVPDPEYFRIGNMMRKAEELNYARGIARCVSSLMEYLSVSVQEAMDILKVPPERREILRHWFKDQWA